MEDEVANGLTPKMPPDVTEEFESPSPMGAAVVRTAASVQNESGTDWWGLHEMPTAAPQHVSPSEHAIPSAMQPLPGVTWQSAKKLSQQSPKN